MGKMRIETESRLEGFCDAVNRSRKMIKVLCLEGKSLHERAKQVGDGNFDEKSCMDEKEELQCEFCVRPGRLSDSPRRCLPSSSTSTTPVRSHAASKKHQHTNSLDFLGLACNQCSFLTDMVSHDGKNTPPHAWPAARPIIT